MGQVELEDNAEPNVMTFLNGYSLLVIGASNNYIYILKFITKES